MPNKHFCQGPTCHEQPTQSRLQKATGLLRSRYASLPIDHDTENHYSSNMFKYFCSQSCANQWLDKNMACVEGRTVVPFTTHRKTSEQQYENKKIKARYGDYSYNEIVRV
jgi:hypothetical protein